MNKIKIIRATTVPQSLCFFDGTMPELTKCYDVHLLSSHGRELDNRGKTYGVSCHPIDIQRRLSPAKDVISLLKIIKVFRDEKPYMVHSMTPKAGLLCMIAAWCTNVPIRIHTFTGLVWPTETGLKRKLLMVTDKITCLCATHIIPEGAGVKADLINGRITKKTLKVLGYGNVRGVDMKRFSLREEIVSLAQKIRIEDSYTFLYVGRIVKDKGINELISAFSRLTKTYTNARLILIGTFEDKIDPVSDETQSTISNNQQIMFVGPKTGDELVAYYAASDCFVFPSYREGFPNVVLEAGAMGLPCIVTNINGSREIIENDKNGLIVSSKDENALYEAMAYMICNSDESSRMASNAREMIANRFEQSYVQKCLLEYYNEIIH